MVGCGFFRSSALQIFCEMPLGAMDELRRSRIVPTRREMSGKGVYWAIYGRFFALLCILLDHISQITTILRLDGATFHRPHTAPERMSGRRSVSMAFLSQGVCSSPC